MLLLAQKHSLWLVFADLRDLSSAYIHRLVPRFVHFSMTEISNREERVLLTDTVLDRCC